MSSQLSTSTTLEVAFHPVPAGWLDILIAGLAEAGFDSFYEEDDRLLAYIPEAGYDEMAIRRMVQNYAGLKDLFWTVARIPEKNWNTIWERSFEPVLIANKCYIRAPFHPAYSIQDPGSLIEIIIEPKMSFGTAHHETTSLMMEALLEENITGQTVLDMGCGTGILAILASGMGARRVVAIDFDERAVENALENVRKNNSDNVFVIQGDISAIPGEPFDVILANINRNTLIEQIPAYAGALREGGSLFLSGFYADDLPAIIVRTTEFNLKMAGNREKNHWIVAKFDR